MSTWTSPKTWTAVVVTALDMNTHVRDNLNALHWAILSKSGDYTVATSDGQNVLVKVDASGAGRTISLPTAVGNAGMGVMVEKTDTSANTVTVDPNGSETIGFFTTLILQGQGDAVSIVSDGAAWQIVGRGAMPGHVYFPTTQNPSTLPNVLDDYEEGTWTPSDGSGAGLALTLGTCEYIKVGQDVTCYFDIVYPATASGANGQINGLPFTSRTVAGGPGGALTETNYSASVATLRVSSASTNFTWRDTAGASITNALLSGRTMRGFVNYRASA